MTDTEHEHEHEEPDHDQRDPDRPDNDPPEGEHPLDMRARYLAEGRAWPPWTDDDVAASMGPVA
jgi:hypothetical protein